MILRLLEQAWASHLKVRDASGLLDSDMGLGWHGLLYKSSRYPKARRWRVGHSTVVPKADMNYEVRVLMMDDYASRTKKDGQ